MSTSRILNRRDVIKRIVTCLDETDGVSLSDIYNNMISIVNIDKPIITYEENNIFIEER
jgi:hypothetical protein